MMKYLISRGIQALKSIRHCRWKFGVLNTEAVPSRKIAYTNWLSEENVACEISAKNFPVTHWKYETENTIFFNKTCFSEKPLLIMEGEMTKKAPVQCILVSLLHILQDKCHAQQGSEFDPGETGFGCLTVVAPHQGSAWICCSPFPIHHNSTQQSGEEKGTQ